MPNNNDKKVETKDVKTIVNKTTDNKLATKIQVTNKNETKKVDESKKTMVKATKKVAPVVVKKTVKYSKVEDLNKNIFNIKVNTQAIFDSIMSERASRRQGTHQVKNRSAVAGGGAKPWRQKGTGRARAGTLSSPIFRSGGVIFGPQKNKNYKLNVNKKIKQLAFKSALTLKAKENGIFIADVKIAKPKTKAIIEFVKTMDLGKKQRKILFISDDINLFKSSANLKNIDTIKLNNLLVEKILHYDVLVFSNKSYKELEGRF